MEIGDLIRKKRTERKLSQRALAKLLNVSHGAVAQWEVGTSAPTNTHMSALKTALGIGEKVEGSPDAHMRVNWSMIPTNLAWLRFWESMNDERRTLITEMLHIGLPSRKAQ